MATPVAAKAIQISSVSGVPQNSTGILNVSIIAPQSADALTLSFTYDSGVMNISRRLNTVADWSFVQTPGVGSYLSSGYANDPAYSLNADTRLYDFQCEALRQDGKRSFFNVTITSLEENGVEKKAEYTTINGSFTPIDVVPPVITIMTPLNGDTVSQDINVTADITDVGGVNATSIAVTIDGVSATLLNTNPITNGYRINATRTGVALGARNIAVAAQDTSNNANSSTIGVTVAQSGFTFDPNLQGYSNSTSPFVNALFVQVNAASIRMFINNIDVTASCTKTGVTTGNISYDLVLPDGVHSIVVNGTSSLTPQEVSATETFTKDTILPLVVVNSITDSDGDGYAEAGELLTITYTVTDLNPFMVGIDTAWNTSAPTGTLFYSSTTGNQIGNLNKSITAIDRAININQSSPFHIYNNYLAYISDPKLGNLAGLDLTKTSLYDIFTYANAITIAGPPSHLNFPNLGTFQKTLIGGQNVTLDNRKNLPVSNTSLPTAIDFYPTSSGNLDFSLQVANVTNATMIIGKANSTLLNQLIGGGTKAASVNLGEMLAQDTVVMYGHVGGAYGYAIIDARDPNNMVIRSQQGSIIFYNTNLPRTIRENALDISSGFNTATTVGSLPISALGKGEYVIIAMCMDYDRVGMITLKTFEVTETANALTTSKTVYDIGTPVIVNSTLQGNKIAGVLVKESPLYTGNMTFNFTTIGTGSLEKMTLYADGNTTIRKLVGNIWISEGYGNYSVATNASTVNVPTTGLLAGNYTVYMILENSGNLTSLGQTTVTLRGITPSPANVDLGLAANYAILSKTGITTTGTSNITGNMGVSPIAAVAITGFALAMDPSNQFSTSSQVIGRVYAADYAPPTPALLTTAVSNMETAFTDAAGRTPPTATELYGGNLGGKTLTPGIYKWSTGVLIPTSTALTLDAQGNASAVWIFQVAQDLTMDTTSNMVLTNGAKAENIYWQIDGATGVTLEAGAHAEGNLLAKKAIIMKSGASLNGRALAQTAVTLIANTVTVPPASVGPVANFTGTPTAGIAPLTVTFLDTSSGIPTSWNWSFGDGTLSVLQHPVHTYANDGSYNVSLNVMNAAGSSTKTLAYYINVSSVPVANFTANVTSGTAPLAVQFTDSSTGTPTSWLWSFGDGLTETVQNPIHTYATAGYYDVSLRATNAFGFNTVTRIGYIQANNVTTPVVPGSTILGNTFSVNKTGNEANYTFFGNNIILTNITGFSRITILTDGLNQSGGNLTGNVTSVLYSLAPVITDLEGQRVTVQADVTKGSWNNTCNFTIGIALTTPAQNTDYQNNLPAGATGYNPFSVLSITTSGSDAIGSVLNISIPYTWYTNYTNPGPINPGQNFTYVMWTHGTPAVTTPLTPTWGPTDLPSKWFTVQTNGFSTFGMIGATAQSSSPPTPPSPSGGGGGGGSGGGGTFTGKIIQYGVPQKPGLTQPAVTITTLIPGTGIAESGPVVADLVGIEGVRAAWSVNINQQPDANAKITTSIIQEPSAQVQNSYRIALQGMKLDIAQIAYVMQITKSGVTSTGPATISMSIPQSWINNYGGMEAIRIVRMDDDGTSEVLTTTFSNYDMNTGYLNFKAISPKGLSTFGLIAVKTYVPGAATPVITPVVTPSATVTPVQPTPTGLPFTTIIGAVIVVLIIVGIGIYFYTRKHE